MTAMLAVRHHVRDYAAWRKVYEDAESMRVQYGCTAQRVMRMPDDQNELFITHDFPTVKQAEDFARNPALRDAMDHAGVEGTPRMEIYTDI